MSTVDNEDLSKTLVDCQAKLLEIDNKLTHIKNQCKTRRTKHNKYSLHTNEDFIILKKETESLESDIQFVKSLIEESTEIQSSFPLRLMKKVFPTKMFSSQNKHLTNEMKANIIAHSTALLEEKVKILQTVASSKKKKRKAKRESKDSVVTNTTNSIKPTASLFRPKASSDSEIFMNPEKIPSIKVLSSLKKRDDLSSNIRSSTELMFLDTETSKYLPSSSKNLVTSSIKKTPSQIEYTFTTYSNQQVQTADMLSHLSLNTTEKYVQTDFPSVTWVSAVMNQGKSANRCQEKETNTDKDVATVKKTCISNNNFCHIKASQNQKLLPSLVNVLDINEIDNIISNLLYSPLKMLQCKHINKLSSGNVSNPPGYVNLIIRQSDFMPLIMSEIEERTTKTCKQFFPEDLICFAYTYHVKLIRSYITFKYNENNHSLNKEEKKSSDISIKHYPTEYNNKVGKTEFSVQYQNAENERKPRVSNTLQIDYKNPQTSGRIILTEYGDSQSSAQSEMITRILTHLIGLPNSKVDDK